MGMLLFMGGMFLALAGIIAFLAGLFPGVRRKYPRVLKQSAGAVFVGFALFIATPFIFPALQEYEPSENQQVAASAQAAEKPEVEQTPEEATPPAAQQLEPREPEPVSVTFTSDPPNAVLYVAGGERGSTPITVEVPAETEMAYRLVVPEEGSDYALYKPFDGVLNASKDESISVWIERTTAEEQEAQRAEAEQRRLEEVENKLESLSGQIRTVCHELVRDQLVSPSTAKFPGVFGDWTYRYWPNMGVAKYIAQVDSQNVFGAMVRSKFTCRYELETDMISLEYLIAF